MRSRRASTGKWSARAWLHEPFGGRQRGPISGIVGLPTLSAGTDMTFPRASTALSRFTVLDLTRVRAGPTCVRQLADWGPNCIKIAMPDHMSECEGLGGSREGSDFQNLHRNKRSIT